MTPTVLVVGSLHHDIMVEADHLPRRDETAVGTRWYPKFGGKGGNQAAAAARTGAAARMAGAVGDDGFGAFMRAGLRAAGVDDAAVQTLNAPTGMSVAIMDAGGDYAATIVSGANLAIDPAGMADAALWDGVRVLLLQNEVPEAVNLAAAVQARRRGLPVLLNAAPARALSPALQRLVDVLIVNAVEAEMMGAPPVACLADAAIAAEHLAARFEAVVVTAGGHGLAGWSVTDERFAIPAEPVKVVSTHGAGDAFCGTLAAELAKGSTLPQAAAVASGAAARHVAGSVSTG